MKHLASHLDPKAFSNSPQMEPTRNGFGRGLVTAGEKSDQVVALCADLAESTRMHHFREAFPDRYVELGVAEQNLATVASGMAAMGKIPFMSSYATFSPGRNNEQIRTTICINKMPVKVVGSHAGISVGPDGATHQALEDIALMRVLPHMTVVYPGDAIEAEKATIAIAENDKPTYLRLARAKTPTFTTKDSPFSLTKALPLFTPEKPVVTVFSTGPLTHEALKAASTMTEKGITAQVIHVPVIKPLDTETILAAVQKSSAVVTVEEHQIAAGFGSAIAEVLAAHHPMPIEFIGVHDRFGQSGNPDELLREYQLDEQAISQAIERAAMRVNQ
ncbi:MAG: transketolase C-terminal domain-containing protein [Bacteroidota bacterium]